MRLVIAAILLAGCMQPTLDAEPGHEPVPLPLLRDISLAASGWPDHDCSDGIPMATAPLLPPFDQGAEVAVQAIARGLGIDLTGAAVEERTTLQGERTGWRVSVANVTIDIGLPSETPAPISVAWDHMAWPGEAPEAHTARLSAAIDPEGRLVWSNSDRDHRATPPWPPATDGWVSAYWHTFSGFPRSSLWFYPLQDTSQPPGTDETAAREAARSLLACAQPDAELAADQGGYPLRVARHGTHVWSFLAQAPDPAHHCGGQAWFVLVDTQGGGALGIEDRLCY